MRRSAQLLRIVVAAVFLWPAAGWGQAWTTLRPAGGGFSVLVPGDPGPPVVDNKPDVALYSWVVRTAYGGLIVGYGEYPANPPPVDVEIRATLDNFLREMKSAVQSQRRGSFQSARGASLPALDFSYAGQGIGGSGKIIIDGRRTYMLVSVVRSGQDAGADSSRFLQSFVIGTPDAR